MSSTSHSAERADVYTRITAEIVAAIEAGAGEWRMPWHHDGTAVTRPENISSGKRYRGVNVLALWIAAQARRFCRRSLGHVPPMASRRRSGAQRRARDDRRPLEAGKG